MRAALAAAGLATLATFVTTAEAAPAAPAAAQRPVIAVVGDPGLNVLHDEFRTKDGKDPVYPAGMPRPVMVDLPRAGSFAERLALVMAGPLGDPQAGTLYGLRGTRLLVYVPPGVDDVLTDRAHGTGVASSAGGTRTGSAPDALVVFVPGAESAAYQWTAEQRWIDVASTSVYSIRTTDQCAGAEAVRQLHRDGGLLFSSSGNTQDVAEPASIPNGLPEVFQVGGVDATGRTWLPPRPEEEEPFFAVGNVVRPYETGARFSFPAASGDSLTEDQPFGGTSGATPTVAGYAAELVREARRLLGHRGGRTPDALARRAPGVTAPRSGPLADGVFTRDELVRLLHVTAVPAEQSASDRYLIEGYGATGTASHRSAVQVLQGRAAAPARPDEDADHQQAERLRSSLTGRC